MSKRFQYADGIERYIQVREHATLEKIFDNEQDFWNSLLIDEIKNLVNDPNYEIGDVLQEIILCKYPKNDIYRNGLSKEFFNNLKIYIQSENDINDMIRHAIKISTISSPKCYARSESEYSDSEYYTDSECYADDENESDDDLHCQHKIILLENNFAFYNTISPLNLDELAKELNETYLVPYARTDKLGEAPEPPSE